MGNTSQEVGYGLQNTLNYLANTVNATNGTASSDYTNHPSLYKGLIDFRSTYSTNWFLPSVNELKLIPVNSLESKLSFEPSTGTYSAAYNFWSSSERSSSEAYYMFLNDDLVSYGNYDSRYNFTSVRLCRAF